MTTLFGILGIGRNALIAQNFGTQVASQNISNVNTEGYTRRATVLDPLGPSPGYGVRARDARRVIDPFIEKRLLNARSSSGESTMRAQSLEILDTVFGDSVGGISESLQNFRAAISDLTANPNSTAARSVVLSRAQSLATSFHSAADDLQEARIDANQRIADEVRQANLEIQQIAKLGVQIAQAEVTGQEASDLRDQRDTLIRQLADRVPVTVLPEANGQVTVLLGGSKLLVAPNGQASTLQTTVDANGDVQVQRTTAGAPEDLTSLITTGNIGGLIAARNGSLTDAQNAVDQLAYDIAGAYNAVHTAGFGLDSVSGRNLFTPFGTVAGAAANFSVSSDVDGQPQALAAAQAAAALPGDNRNALALQALRDATFALGGTATADDALASFTAMFGSALQEANIQKEQAIATQDQVSALRESVSGVSLDEEMIALTRFQRGYEAALKVVKTADEMLDALMLMKR